MRNRTELETRQTAEANSCPTAELDTDTLAETPGAQTLRQPFQKYFLYFFLYSIVGWCYEVFLEVVIYGWGFSNRGFLFGPYCPVYGVGALIFLFTLSRLKKGRVAIGKIDLKPILIFICTMAIATVLELFTSYLMEAATGSWLWDYTDDACNFQGRIALSPSVRFGIGGVLILYLIQPVFERLTKSIGSKGVDIAFVICFAVFLLDIIGTSIVKFIL